MKMNEDDVYGTMDSVGVWAAITSGEKYQDSNLPLLRVFAQKRRLEDPQHS